MSASIEICVKDKEKECPYQKVFIDHDTEMCLRHEAVWVQEAEDGDGGGQEDAQHLGVRSVMTSDVNSDVTTQVRTIL